MQHVVIDHLVFVLDQNFSLLVKGLEQLVPECGYHEELLQHGNHVAYVTQVSDSHMLVSLPDLVLWCMTEIYRSWYVFQKRPQMFLQKLRHIRWVKLA